MATISVNVYDKHDKSKVEKTYTVDGYDLMFGTVEEFVNVIDVDKLDDNKEIMRMIIEGYSKLKPLLKDIFPGISDDELDRTKVTDLVRVIVDTGTAVVESFSFLKSGNRPRA